MDWRQQSLKQEGGAWWGFFSETGRWSLFFLSRSIVLQLAVIVYHNLKCDRGAEAHRSNTTCELERVLDGMDRVESDVGGYFPQLDSIARNYIQHQRVVTSNF